MALRFRRAALVAALFVSAAFVPAQAAWKSDASGLTWVANGRLVWKYNLDPAQGMSYFYPLTWAGGRSLVIASPDDHPWHYGLWFSWKYINGSNYWEQSRATGKAEGQTRWKVVKLERKPDGSAFIQLDVTYTGKSGAVDLTERREIRVTPATRDGSYNIWWNSWFTAGAEGAVLDRSPMPGEPNGQVNGGYAGLGARLLPPPTVLTFVTEEGPIGRFEGSRARPRTPAIAANFSEGGKPVGAIAVYSQPDESGPNVPWYVVDASQTDTQMRFFNQSLLAPKVIRLAPGQMLHQSYRIGIAPAFTPEALKAFGSARK
jgi:hypothetical protein